MGDDCWLRAALWLYGDFQCDVIRGAASFLQILQHRRILNRRCTPVQSQNMNALAAEVHVTLPSVSL